MGYANWTHVIFVSCAERSMGEMEEELAAADALAEVQSKAETETPKPAPQTIQVYPVSCVCNTIAAVPNVRTGARSR